MFFKKKEKRMKWQCGLTRARHGMSSREWIILCLIAIIEKIHTSVSCFSASSRWLGSNVARKTSTSLATSMITGFRKKKVRSLLQRPETACNVDGIRAKRGSCVMNANENVCRKILTYNSIQSKLKGGGVNCFFYILFLFIFINNSWTI